MSLLWWVCGCNNESTVAESLGLLRGTIGDLFTTTRSGDDVAGKTKPQRNMDSVQGESEEIKKLIAACVKAKEHSYSPYSKFRVGAALLTSDDQIITGCNVENVSYGLTICAERTALVKAVSEGHLQFKAIAVSTDVVSTFTYPCGACRQFMAEFGDCKVYLVTGDGNLTKTTLEEILPHTFHKHDLKEGQGNNQK